MPADGDITMRRAGFSDIARLCELLGCLFGQEAEFKPDAQRQAEGLRLILDNPETGRIHCALADGVVVGMVSILFTVSTAEGGRAALLEDMVIHPDWRGMEIGVRLLDAAIQEAREAGCLRITLLTDATNAGAMRFYERAGFIRSPMVPFRLRF
jgi:GNAT superfamily N-acetyltransferase